MLTWEKANKKLVLNTDTLFLLENKYLLGVRIVSLIN